MSDTQTDTAPAGNFAFLAAGFADLLEDAAQAEATALVQPRTAAFYARRTLERAVK